MKRENKTKDTENLYILIWDRPLSKEEIEQVYNYLMKGKGKMIKDGLILISKHLKEVIK